MHDTVHYLQCYDISPRVNIQLSRQNAELYNKCLLHLCLPMGENPQIYGACPFLPISEEEWPVHRLSYVCVEWRKDLSAVRTTDYPSNLSKCKTSSNWLTSMLKNTHWWENASFLAEDIVARTVAFPTSPPVLSTTRLSLSVELGLITAIRLSLRKRTTPLRESLLAMVSLATCWEPRTAPPVAPTSRTSNISAYSLEEIINWN